jgi:hypothetical protein
MVISLISIFTIENMFNYRPFVINWCMSLISLDGSIIVQKE